MEDLLTWCLVANVAEPTRRFAPGAKVWVLPPQWGDTEEMVVVGRPRGRREYVKLVMPSRLLRDFRIRGVYSPSVLEKLHAPMSGLPEMKLWEGKEHCELLHRTRVGVDGRWH